MKKLALVFLSVILLSGCGVLDRGNYDKNRDGYVLSGNLLVSYHTNSIGEIDVFQIDQVMSFFEALEYTSFNNDLLDNDSTISSLVTLEELDGCGVDSGIAIPRFIRTSEGTYFYNVRENGYCTYDEYIFHEQGFTIDTVYEIQETSPIESKNTTLFKQADFKANTFEIIVFIENIYYNPSSEIWVKELVTVVPMSIKQSGNIYEDNSGFIEEIEIFEKYVLNNQSINLLELKENYTEEDVNNIWSDKTVEALGRNHDLVKKVRLDQSAQILEIINDTLSRLGMFQ